MKRITLSLAVLGMLAVFNAPASASDLSVFLRGGYHRGHQIARQNHAAHHQDLDHRAFHRELDHREAHRYPMTYNQHGRLHDALDHEAFHDQLEHRSAHQTRAYQPTFRPTYRPNYGPGYGFSYPYGGGYSSGCSPRSGISFSFGF